MVFALIVVIGIIMYRVVEVSGASRDVLSDGMGDRGLASPGEPIQPGWGGILEYLDHKSIASKTASQVPLRNPWRSPYPKWAPRARRQPFSTDNSAVEP